MLSYQIINHYFIYGKLKLLWKNECELIRTKKLHKNISKANLEHQFSLFYTNTHTHINIHKGKGTKSDDGKAFFCVCVSHETTCGFTALLRRFLSSNIFSFSPTKISTLKLLFFVEPIATLSLLLCSFYLRCNTYVYAPFSLLQQCILQAV